MRVRGFDLPRHERGIWHAARARLAGGARVLALVPLALAGCAASRTSSATVPPPTIPAPEILAVADAGRASLSRALQIGADPSAGVAYVLAGHQIFAPVTSSPWADHLVAVTPDTGSTIWQYGTASASFGDQAHRLSGFVVDLATHRVVFAAGQSVLALDGATGATVTSVPLPSGVNCVAYPAPLARPTFDASGRVLFTCQRTDMQVNPVGVLVDLTARTTTLVAAPPLAPPPPPGPGILGHGYVVADDGLRVVASTQGTSVVEALPFAVVDLAGALYVESGADGVPTGRLYLAGAGGQVVIMRDGALAAQRSSVWAAVLAERAVALTVAPDRFRDGRTLPTLPGFLIVPGQLARTPCFGEAQPLTPGTATATTAVDALSSGTFQVDLRLSLRDDHGSEVSARHWVVLIAPDGSASILTDEGRLNPFDALPHVPCPV